MLQQIGQIVLDVLQFSDGEIRVVREGDDIYFLDPKKMYMNTGKGWKEVMGNINVSNIQP